MLKYWARVATAMTYWRPRCSTARPKPSGDLDWIEDDHVEDEDVFGAVSVGEILFVHVRCTSRFPQDAMGSVIGMADASGASTATLKYDTFGTVTSSSGASAVILTSIGTDFRYHGMQLDAASGLYHVRARTYDARTGRFTSRDPVAGVRAEPESRHPYTFNRNNPG
jgi:RHS repeat-associated protein